METINDYMPLSNDWNDERLQTLKQLYPDWFTSEGSLNIDEVKKVVNPESVDETERYEFRWFGKSQAKRNAFTPSNATLVYDEDRSVNPDSSENLIIEGENLEVLKLLSGSYREKVKCIYIDPPYNTGKDFVYSDNFTQDKKGYWEDAEVIENGVKIDTNTETDGRYHSNWLNMMYSRLLIARQLLKEDGVIFISIDDNEVHHLRKICDEVFGEENFLVNIIWEKRFTKSNNSKLFGSITEHLVCYRKSDSLNSVKEPRNEKSDSIYTNPDKDERGVWTSVSYVNPATKDERPNLVYKIQNPITKIQTEHPTNAWKYEYSTYLKHVEDNKLYWGVNGDNSFPRLKKFLFEMDGGMVPSNLWNHKDTGTTDQGSKILEDLMGRSLFDFPKPPSLIKRFLKLHLNSEEDKDFIALDFFGGSGTTGQAVMELNKEDGGNRKFILVQIPEATDEKSETYKAGYKKISDVTIERNKRVIAKIEKELAEKEKKKEGELPLDKAKEPQINLGFKVFKLQKSNFPRVDFAPNPEFNETENLDLLKKYIAEKESQLVNVFNKEELLTEILLKNNFTLNYTTIQQEQFTKNEILFVTDGEKETLICLDVSIAPETASHFKAHTDTKFICLERALDTTTKYNLKHYLGDKFNAF
ncbi:site-specific DNA-methyltransferase [Flavobacterium nackdongense]|uniref:site-specific DNA-methyltransferase (adenine-specific) n=1 Tax=Flavobacterium nackdongense TaxID=2547394 RepID=A0A4P6Y9T2_9FLAO|nr:site-specific DNA-methyltransferase [Flavobacterium nackdongense]QBN19769.1 site-specific DNA-methyltransferase [Flavobacterium nackdongense]